MAFMAYPMINCFSFLFIFYECSLYAMAAYLHEITVTVEVAHHYLGMQLEYQDIDKIFSH